MSKNTIAVDLSTIIGNVSELDTTQASTLQMIPRAQIKANDKNFYDVSNVDGLVDAILMDGLQSPLVVNRNGTEYVIISGHRRFAALSKIIDDGYAITAGKLFATEISGGNIPCLVNEYKSHLQAELALIRANSDTRVLTSPEIAQQASRVEKLLYLLKEEGHDFPGKMRDYVAEACQVSASKLARLKVISNNLLPVFGGAWKNGTLREASAYALARLSTEHQQKLYEVYKTKDSLCYITEYSVNDYAVKLAKLDKRKCTDKSLCSNRDGRWKKLASVGYDYKPCADTCCRQCSQLSTCKNACFKLADITKALRDDAKAKKAQGIIAQAEKDAPKIAAVTQLWARFGEARRQARVSVKTCCEASKIFWDCRTSDEEVGDKELGNTKFTPDAILPYGYGVYLGSVQSMCRLADLFKCSLDFLLCRTDDPTGKLELDPWRHDTDYPTADWLIAILDVGGNRLRKIAWSNYGGKLSFSPNGDELNFTPVAWMPMPPFAKKDNQNEEDTP